MSDSVLRRPWLSALLLAAAVIASYWNSLQAPLLFDDVIAVSNNASIRQLDTALTPPRDGGTTTGRPLLNLSLALNHALHGEDVRGYHAANLLIHVAAVLCLLGLLRRTLATPALATRLGDAAAPLAFVTALIWGVHPLLTESVTCIAQRSESLCGLWYLGTLYGLARGGGPTPVRRWLVVSWLACVAGMATKEVMVTAPVLAFLYDRTFLAGTFAAAWRQRRGYYLGLAASWLVLGALVLGAGGSRGTSAGFGLGISPWTYLLTQCEALVIYLRLSLWPHPLIVDYGTTFVASWREVWVQGILVLSLLAGTVWALCRRPVLGFVGAWFFVILAPSSSFVPLVTQPIAEHRMYLPLAVVVVLLGGAAALRWHPRRFLLGGLVVAVAAGVGTFVRNRAYLDERAMWEEVLTHLPRNARVLNNLGRMQYQQGQLGQAAASFRQSTLLDPSNPFAHFNLGLALMQSGRTAEAVAPYQAAIELRPDFFYAQGNLGLVLTKLDREAEALPHFALALRLNPVPADLHYQWGLALDGLGRWEAAATHYAESVRLMPEHVRALTNWGTALFKLRQFPAAAEKFEAALRLSPDQPEVHFNLGQACSALGRADDAMAHYTAAIRLNPAHAKARLNLGIALAQAGRLTEALAQLEETCRLRPGEAEGFTNLGVALSLAGRNADSLAAYQTALRLAPDDARAHYNVGYALLEANRLAEAKPYFENAVRLRPDYAAARELLRQLQAMGPP